ncbi:hypothetical protein L596_028401 [Steinernema carpocapsae]|uniref:Major facilitator superfamily (MFS) profile domain-containing protein n=1 Tax=Steinernema carpocapsae TaxID=34508 RepID=A0A4U5LYG5_STECR|nr:hypothetical protein L596_028401 [Steinernema carpocapsae]
MRLLALFAGVSWAPPQPLKGSPRSSEIPQLGRGGVAGVFCRLFSLLPNLISSEGGRGRNHFMISDPRSFASFPSLNVDVRKQIAPRDFRTSPVSSKRQTARAASLVVPFGSVSRRGSAAKVLSNRGVAGPTDAGRNFVESRKNDAEHSFWTRTATKPKATMVEQKKYTMVAISDAGVVLNHHKTYKVYPERWFVLVTVCLLALSNATIWISYTPISGATNMFYCGINSTDEEMSAAVTSADSNSTVPIPECNVTYWMSQIFQLVGVLTGIMGMFVTDKYGIRLSCLIGATLNLLGAIIRLFSTFTWISADNRIVVLYVGQTTAALAQSFFLCLSPKVAEYWFPEHQRALANALSFVGKSRSNYANENCFESSSNESPRSGTRHPRSHNPRQRPSARRISYPIEFAHPRPRYHRHGNDHRSPQRPPAHASIASMDMSNSPPFFHGLFLLFKNKSFYIQMLTFGFAFALQWSVFVIGETMFVELGYKGISGYIMALSAVTGCISSILAGMLVDKTKKFNEIIKFCYFGGAVFAVAINLFLRHQKSSGLDTAVFIVLLSMLGWFYIPPFPIGLELGVETTFPVAEATSSGVLVTAGQLVMFVLSSVMAEAVKVDWIYADDLKGLMKPNAYFTKNHQLAIDFWCLAAIFAAFFTFFSLWPRYRRLEFEESTELVKNVNGSDSIESR